MLDQIPPEILSHITLHLLLTSPLPQPPLSLLLTCKSTHETLNPSSNPRLYSRLFQSKFDISAPLRRATSPDDINALSMIAELKKRVAALSRLGKQVRMGNVKDVKDSDLWVLYMMLIENDGRNLQLLLGPEAVVDLPRFLRLYHHQHLLTAALEPGFPTEKQGNSLVVWIGFLLSGHGRPSGEPLEQRDERLFVLRPYVFAAQRYGLYYAPWTLQALPASSTATAASMTDFYNPFVADLTPRARLCKIQHFGKTVLLSPPILAQAAILRFFSKRSPGEMIGMEVPYKALADEDTKWGKDQDDEEDVDLDAEELADSMDEDDDDDSSVTSSIAEEPAKSLILDSRLHDRDFLRLQVCHDPRSGHGVPRSMWRGAWEGSWEGSFSFFDFQAFREMLSGQSKALYEGPFGAQAQVWRLRETYVRPVGFGLRSTTATAKGKGKAKESDTDIDVDASTAEFPEEHDGQPTGLPISGPIINAGFPSDMPVPASAAQHSPSAEAFTMQETIRHQVDAIEGYEIVPESEIDEGLAEGEKGGVEILLTGVGHSAWGRFVLKGRVRAWDGMASLVKEYAPDSRGKWLYRGYVLAGGMFVGRWRDTVTPENLIGYEGTFILKRR